MISLYCNMTNFNTTEEIMEYEKRKSKEVFRIVFSTNYFYIKSK